MRVAVTGASGFIGRHVVAELLARKHEVVVLTRDVHRLPSWRAPVDIVQGDLSELLPADLDRLAAVDYLIHLAWDGLPNYRSRHHFETELPKQYVFLKCLIERGLSSLLVAGTCFEYGMQSGGLVENLPVRPDNAYGYAKDALRQQLGLLARDLPFSLIWARLFYTWGEGQSEKSLYPLLTTAMARGDTEFAMSGGEQLRDYLPVTELANKLVCLATTRSDAGVVNVCSGKPISVRRLVEGWVATAGSSIRLNLGHYPYPDYEPFAFWGATDKLDSLLQ